VSDFGFGLRGKETCLRTDSPDISLSAGQKGENPTAPGNPPVNQEAS